MQLVDEKVRVSSPKKGALEKVVYTREAVKERFGVPPESLADFLVIVGDASDNLPGIKGVGPKSAVELINKFGNLDSILENVAKIGNPRLVSALKEAKNDVATKRKLVLLSSNIPLKIGLEEIEVKEPDGQKLLSIFLRHEFGSSIIGMPASINLPIHSQSLTWDIMGMAYSNNSRAKGIRLRRFSSLSLCFSDISTIC